MDITAFELAERYLGIGDIPGEEHHPLIQWWLSLCEDNHFGLHESDETAWCSAAMHGVCHPLGLPMSRSAMARSWLRMGEPVDLADARRGFDVVILWRGTPDGPQGHVGLFNARAGGMVVLRGGNQVDRFSDAAFPISRVVGVRRLLVE